ncbi:MAG: polyamine aminopropyltransferase [Gammaproteobacteria bacterium]|nr:polyamine aminopropyltransferase [Gammaproteobacteria bacterium]MDH3370758.1 polyamine aminopropyltransferase [Gammaproteobacteria bacterium]MDH3407174.1 polyamine aminopropyltransferase [Gammaproteobacteria bacterium]MDH3562697.1 polyamine aminopropyltransferase [Gammaproteobacteria bacterium]MDH5485937.1 polyamine aminopropyltransferase [Gammaproteobacteria bacterium]
MPLDKTWYTEEWAGQGSAISLKIKDKVHDEKSPYQRIEIYETEAFGTLMTLDGLVMVTDRDNFVYHEMMSHPALFTHPDPKRVLIIGGGDCGTLHEVLKHETVEQAEQVELDERVTRVAEKFFPELCESNHDPRAKLHFTDGIKWVADAKPDTYDVIIIDSTDPVGPAAGLFSETFYRNCLRALRAQGIVVGQSESPLFHAELIRSVQKSFKAAGFRDVGTLFFPQCTYPSGWWSATMAGKDGSIAEFRNQAAAAKSFATRYYNHDIHVASRARPEFLR